MIDIDKLVDRLLAEPAFQAQPDAHIDDLAGEN
jgi:hypothetical protein